MNRFGLLTLTLVLVSLAVAQPEDPGHAHGPDGRHIVTPNTPQVAGSTILSHHDLRIEGPDGKIIRGAIVNTTVSPKGTPSSPIHRERNAYEPENEVYGSHVTYTKPGDYLLRQDVTMPGGKNLKVEFLVYVPAATSGGDAEHAPHGPNYPLIFGGGIAGIVALFLAFRMGRRSAQRGIIGGLTVALATPLLPVHAWAQKDDGHLHGPDGRHIVTSSPSGDQARPKLRAYLGPNRETSATQTRDGFKFVLSIENEEVVPDRDLVEVTENQSKLIGLETAKAEVTGSATGLQASGMVSANPNGLVKVNSRLGGRVVSLGALPGTTVRRGQLLATIESPELAEAQAAYRKAIAELSQSEAGVKVAEAALYSAKAEAQVASQTLIRETRMSRAGEFEFPALERANLAVSAASAALETATAEVSRLEKLLVRLREGAQSGVVAPREVERSQAELSQAISAKTDASTQLQVARAALAREESISRQGLRSSREVDQARAALELARSAQKMASSRLEQSRADVQRARSAVRVARDQISLLGGTVGGGNTITVTAPMAAEVEHRFVSVGQTITSGEPLYDLLNADVVWILANVYESDVPKVRVGQSIKVVADAYPDEVYRGEVAFVHNEVDPQTRTTQVRVVVNNPGERLKQNMFVRVMLGVASTSAVTVPSASVQSDKGLDLVFVEEKPRLFRRTLVRVKGSFGDRTIVEGIDPGRSVATSGSYQLLSFGGQ